MKNKSIFVATIGSIFKITEGSRYPFEVLSLTDVYEQHNDGTRCIIADKMTIRLSNTIKKAVNEAPVDEDGKRKLYFSAKWAVQSKFYVGTVVTEPIRKLTNIKAIKGAFQQNEALPEKDTNNDNAIFLTIEELNRMTDKEIKAIRGNIRLVRKPKPI